MFACTRYDKKTGEIMNVFYSPDQEQITAIIAMEHDEFGHVSGDFNPERHYVVNSKVVPKSKFAIPSEMALKKGSISTFAVPNGTSVSMDGAEIGKVRNGKLEVTASMPATYSITLSKPLYITKTIKVLVDEA